MCRLLIAFGVSAMIFASALAPRGLGSPLREIAPSTVAFSSDGVRYAAWQAPGDEHIVTLDTLTGQQRRITPPASCKLVGEASAGMLMSTAAGGRFLLECDEHERQALLDARTGASLLLPQVSGREWESVGTRYVAGSDQPCPHSAEEHCRDLYDIATGAVSNSYPESAVIDLDRPGAPANAVCPTLRRSVLKIAREEQPFEQTYAYLNGLFAHPFGRHGNVQIDRCNGRPTILHARGGEPGKGEPLHFNLRGGLLSWDTGSEAVNYIPPEPMYRGRLYTYNVSTHRRREWLLPRVRVQAPEPITGTYGYSTHTADVVFWIATRTVEGGKVNTITSSAVYAARF
ncbi:MAG TPA: hypothetical protein VIJ33_03240 [Solirubrobacteraceae bacterium]